MIRLTRAVPLAVLVTAALAAACGKKTVETPAPVTTTVNQDSINRENARRDSIARAEQARRDAAAAEQARLQKIRDDSIARAQVMANAVVETKNSLLAPIHFDFDKSDISDQDRAVLDQKIRMLNANPNVRLRISGHADERGSDEYNMALGQRRAAAAKRYLQDHGIDTGRIDIVSFGEERPICQDHQESCWAQNRRDEFEITAGGDNLVAPRGK